ncbi:uncharacterized protein A4U43_C02F13310 [Asparagus officinalis]|uniref:NAC domain-containing protein n=1 Tax=Asparagus officinalis TaxID=4686 RepID=A0A5P1FI02_ASPOF|nr:NAC domain-containing protein 41-like [Asparagus officinalis]ONK78015.1 uncharacterized protein A4U43_C02F13310 [Asparagus officinalis]
MMEPPSCPGFEFNPGDDHLLTFYLPRKIAGGRDALAIPNYLIRDFDVYSTEPWNLPRDTFRYQNKKKDMYFFSCRQPTSANSKRVQRTAGHGFWYGARGDEKVYYESQHVGYKTVLTFKYIKGGKEINSNWIMHEFHLKPPENGNKFESKVLCRIHMNNTKKDSEGGADAESGVAALIEQEEQGTASVVTNIKERPRKRKRVDVSSSLPSTSSSLPAFVPCKEAEALISTLDEKPHTVFEQKEEVDERQVIEMLLKEHEVMTNHSMAAAEFHNSYEASSSLINVLPPTSQDDGTWEDLDIDVSTVSYLDELMECFTDS